MNVSDESCEQVKRIREFLSTHPIGTSLCPPLHHIGILSSGGRTNTSVKTHPADTSLQANNIGLQHQQRQSRSKSTTRKLKSMNFRQNSPSTANLGDGTLVSVPVCRLFDGRFDGKFKLVQ
ncbi:hypothetical protein DAPPUDRAFT_253488 [Daphnia pulex]|uniref:Uncharacterized protein n=1 Tax=Daphnia pulex TaxID=6669 RepID=E9H4Y4_DAPPU|nr:hypothetical protein DAPPUDRAFT_253488 [Daphnia pulex]|eukprot:EFX73224.1 hypothetical protein DAPPUDRAFT_253488 [Daphnia pulex]